MDPWRSQRARHTLEPEVQRLRRGKSRMSQAFRCFEEGKRKRSKAATAPGSCCNVLPNAREKTKGYPRGGPAGRHVRGEGVGDDLVSLEYWCALLHTKSCTLPSQCIRKRMTRSSSLVSVRMGPQRVGRCKGFAEFSQRCIIYDITTAQPLTFTQI